MKQMPGRVTKQTFTLINPTVAVFSLSFYVPNSGSWRFLTASLSLWWTRVSCRVVEDARVRSCPMGGRGPSSLFLLYLTPKSVWLVCMVLSLCYRDTDGPSCAFFFLFWFVVILSKHEQSPD